MIQHKWKSEYLALQGIVEMVPIAWLKQIALVNPSEHAEDIMQNPLSMKDLATDIKRNGLLNPAVIEISRQTHASRLIAGNHRIVALATLHETHMPAYVSLINSFGDSPEDGIEMLLTHHYFWHYANTTTNDAVVVERPSKIFRELLNNEI